MDTTSTIRDAIEAAPRNGITKPYDVAVSVEVALREAGYKIVRQSKREVEKNATKRAERDERASFRKSERAREAARGASSGHLGDGSMPVLDDFRLPAR